MASSTDPGLWNVDSPIIDPAVDERAPGKLSHCWCVKFCEYCENDNFIELNVQIAEILHRTLDTDLVWFFFGVVL